MEWRRWFAQYREQVLSKSHSSSHLKVLETIHSLPDRSSLSNQWECLPYYFDIVSDTQKNSLLYPLVFLFDIILGQLSIGYWSYESQTWPIKWNAVSSRQRSYRYCCMDALRLEKKLDGNYTRMFRAILNKTWRQHPTRHQLYSHMPPITKTIQVRRTRHAGHC